MTLILGIDPGLASTGWGLVRKTGRTLAYVAHGCITTKPGDGSVLERALRVGDAMRDVYEHRAHGALIAVEEWVYYEDSNGAQAHSLGLVIGAILGRNNTVGRLDGCRAQDWRTGLGLARTATKTEAQERVRAVLGLADVVRPQHASDALAVAIVAAGRLKAKGVGR